MSAYFSGSYLLDAAVVGLAGSAISANGAKSAANTQSAALTAGQQVQQNEFNTITAQEQPFIQGGYGALNQLNYLMGIPGQQPQVSQTGPSYGGTAGGNTIGGGGNRPGNGPGYQTGWSPGGGLQVMPSGAGTQVAAQQSGAQASTQAGQPPAGQAVPGGYGSLNAPFTADMMKQYSPAYQFQLQQGGQGVLNQSSANTGSESGAAMKDLMGYNQNLANTAFNNAFNQYNTQQGNTYNRLMGVSTLGQNAAANLGTQGTTIAGNQSQLLASQGAANAAGQVGVANAYSSAASNMVPWLMSQNNTASMGG